MNKVPIIRSKPLTRPLKPSAAVYIPYTIQNEKPRQKGLGTTSLYAAQKMSRLPITTGRTTTGRTPTAPTFIGPHLITAATAASGNNFRGRQGDAPKAYEPAGQEPKPLVPFVHFPFSQGSGSPTAGSFPGLSL